MSSNTDQHYQIALDGGDSNHFGIARISKVGAALIGGACLVLLSSAALSGSTTKPHSTFETESVNLAVMPSSSLRANPMTKIGAAQLPGPSPWKELAIEAINANNRCENRDVSMQAFSQKLRNLDPRSMTVWAEAEAKVEKIKSMPGILPPIGFFDPWGLSTKDEVFDGTLAFYREAELKHGRTCMLAFLGIVVGEKFHPFTGSADVDILGIPFQETPLTTFFLSIVGLFAAITEGTSFSRIDAMVQKEDPSVLPGDLGFDPLGLKPKQADAYLAMQNKEISNGRLAMLAVAGIIGAEQATNTKIFG